MMCPQLDLLFPAGAGFARGHCPVASIETSIYYISNFPQTNYANDSDYNFTSEKSNAPLAMHKIIAYDTTQQKYFIRLKTLFFKCMIIHLKT